MKAANRNLLLFGIPSLLILAGGICFFLMGEALLAGVTEATPALPQGEVGDVEGYALLIQLLGVGFGGLAGFMVQMLGLLFILYGGSILLFALIARVIYQNRPGRILAYRILTGILLFILLSPGPELFSLFVRNLFQGSFSLGLLTAMAAMILVAVAGWQNTFTSRILEGGPGESFPLK